MEILRGSSSLHNEGKHSEQGLRGALADVGFGGDKMIYKQTRNYENQNKMIFDGVG